jgi:tryptophan synthase alpha chain
MNRIGRVFKEKRGGILSVYFTAGYPGLHDTMPVLRALAGGGVDMVEIGIPFSDPMADGAVIQGSSSQALRNGMSMRLLFEELRGMREEVEIPVLLMGYLNPLMQYGYEAFFRDAAAVGVDGVIVPDLPFDEYMGEWKGLSARYGVQVVMLITPETSEERVRRIDAETEGFIYMVSSASTTGAQERFGEEREAYFRRIGGMGLRNPRLVGFGVSNAATYGAALAHADGAIVGSKFVELLRQSPVSLRGAGAGSREFSSAVEELIKVLTFVNH